MWLRNWSCFQGGSIAVKTFYRGYAFIKFRPQPSFRSLPSMAPHNTSSPRYMSPTFIGKPDRRVPTVLNS